MNRTLIRVQFGSHVYGTNVETSDRDYKSLFVPDPLDLIMQRAAKHVQNNTKKDSAQRNTADDIDDESFSVQTFVRLLMEGQTVALDMLFTPQSWWIHNCDYGEWVYIQSVARKHLLHSGTSAFVGYTKQQAAKYGLKGGRVHALEETVDFLEIACYDRLLDHAERVKEFVNSYKPPSDGKDPAIKIVMCKGPNGKEEPHLCVANRKVPFHASFKYAREIYQRILDNYGERARQAERNEGVDWKAMMHAVRVAKEAYELLTTRNITFPRPEADLLLKIRKGEMHIKDVQQIIEDGLYAIEEVQPHSVLPKEPDRAKAEELVRDFHEDVLRDYFDDRYGA